MQEFISYEELITVYNVPEETVKTSCKRYRQKKSKSWTNFKDTFDKRKVWIHLKSIPERTKQKYNIPLTWQEYEEQKERAEIERKKFEKEFEEQQDLKALLFAYEEQWQEYYPLYLDRLEYNKKKSDKYAMPYAKEHAFWLAMVDISGGKYGTAFGVVPKCFELYQKVAQKVPFLYTITHAQYFGIKLKEIKHQLERGCSIVDVLVDKSLNPKPERVKTTDFHKALMFAYLSHPKAYSYRVVTDLVNYNCQLQGLQTISESVIKIIMCTDNEFRTLVDTYRKGKKYMNDTILPYTIRNIAQYPANTWMIDGTPVQFYCHNESRTKIVRLNLFIIIDVCSRKIVGFDISYSENKYNILNALKMAVMNEGYLPKEIVSDNFSASKSEEIKHIQAEMLKMGVVWRYSQVENPQDKTYAERFFGTFQSVEQSLYDDYIGEGITSKRGNRPSPEYLKEVTEKQGVPSYKEAQYRIASMIAKYNEREIGKRKAPNEVCRTFPKPYAVAMDNVKTALLFWKKTSYTVKRGMVKITVAQTEHSFEIKEHQVKMQLQNKKVAVRYDEKDLDWIMLFDYERDEPICECKKSIKINMSLADQTPEDIKNLQKVTAKKKSYKNYLERQKQLIIDKGLEQIGEETLELIHPLALDKNKVNSEESKQLLELYFSQNAISEADKQKTEQKTLGEIKHSTTVDTREFLLENKKPVRRSLLQKS